MPRPHLSLYKLRELERRGEDASEEYERLAEKIKKGATVGGNKIDCLVLWGSYNPDYTLEEKLKIASDLENKVITWQDDVIIIATQWEYKTGRQYTLYQVGEYFKGRIYWDPKHERVSFPTKCHVNIYPFKMEMGHGTIKVPVPKLDTTRVLSHKEAYNEFSPSQRSMYKLALKDLRLEPS